MIVYLVIRAVHRPYVIAVVTSLAEANRTLAAEARRCGERETCYLIERHEVRV